MAKAKPKAATTPADKIERWNIAVDYVESCNCNFGCPCNFSGYPTDGFCEALVGYHIREGRFGPTRLDGLDVGSLGDVVHHHDRRGRVAEQAVELDVQARKGSGPFELFAGTMAQDTEVIDAAIEFHVDGRQSAFRVPGVLDVALRVQHGEPRRAAPR